MARVSVERPLDSKKEEKLFERFFMALASLGNWQEAEAFLVEFLTEQELTMLAKRLELYKRVSDKQNYKKIIKDLKVTAQTVSQAKKKMERADAYFERVLKKFKILDRRLK